MFQLTFTKRVWLLGIIVLLFVGASFYFVVGKGVRKSVSDLTSERERLLARAEASNLQVFFKTFGESLADLAQSSGVKRRDWTTKSDLDSFIEQWKDTDVVVGIVFTDSSGVVRFNSNTNNQPDLNTSLADTSHFNWSKNRAKRGEFFVGEPTLGTFGASKDTMIVPVATPVYDNGLFLGMLAAAIQLDPLSHNYLETLKVSDETETYLLDDSGKVIYNHANSSLVGLSEAEFNEHFDLNVKDILNTKEDGVVRTKEYLVTYDPVFLENEQWTLIMASRKKDLTDIMGGFEIKRLAVLFILYLTIISFGLAVNRINQNRK